MAENIDDKFSWCSQLNICDHCVKESEGVELIKGNLKIDLCGECMIKIAGLKIAREVILKEKTL